MEDFEDDETYIDEQFNQAIKFVPTIVTQLDVKTKLQLYGFYKQATEGPCNIPKPGFFSFEAKSKWESWNELKQISVMEARKKYVELLNEIDASWYKKKVKGAVFVSRPICELELNVGDERSIFDVVKTGDLAELKNLLTSNPSLIDVMDDEGMNLLHWAADRDHSEIVEFLLVSGIDVNHLDSMNQSALIYGAAANNFKTVEVLLKYNPNREIRDEDGLTAVELTTDYKIKKLLS